MANKYAHLLPMLAACAGAGPVLLSPTLLNRARGQFPTDEQVAAAVLAFSPVPSSVRSSCLGSGMLAFYATASCTDPEWLAEVAASPRAGTQWVRWGLAVNPLTSPDLLESLATTPTRPTQMRACTNPATPSTAVLDALTANPRLGVHSKDAARAVFAGSVMRAHPGTVSFFASHRNSTFRRLAARMPLDASQVKSLYSSGFGIAGRDAVLTNPLVPSDEFLPAWAQARPERAFVSGLLASQHNSAQWAVKAVEASSPLLDRVLADGMASGLYTRQDACDVMEALVYRAKRADVRDVEPDVLADVVDVGGFPLALDAAAAFSSSRISGAADRSFKVAASLPVLDMYSHIMSWAPHSPSSRDDLLDFFQVMDTASTAVVRLGSDEHAWAVALGAARTWTGPLGEIVDVACDTLAAPASRVRVAPSRPARTPRAH